MSLLFGSCLTWMATGHEVSYYYEHYASNPKLKWDLVLSDFVAFSTSVLILLSSVLLPACAAYLLWKKYEGPPSTSPGASGRA